jgi:PBP1b-binding outer membrane lipoprotein LpoB
MRIWYHELWSAEEVSMKRYAVLALVALTLSGCSGVVQKNFKVFADPPDADIRVVSGTELTEKKYRSPASVTAGVPKDPALASKAVLEVSRDSYRPVIMLLSAIREGQTLNIKLEKTVQSLARYRLSYRMVEPSMSDTLQFRDDKVAVSFTITGRSLQMRFENLSASEVKILWDRSEYTDVKKQTHRLMHSGVRFQDRNNPIPAQVVPSHASVQEAVFPIDKVTISQLKRIYEVQPLLLLDNDTAAALKGKEIVLFIPVEINRQIIPYNFKIEITDAVKEEGKE